MINDTGGHIIGPIIRPALTALLSLMIILTLGITGCIYTAGFNNPVSGISMATDIESEAGSGDASRNIITSKVILTPYKETEPIDIESISSVMVQQFNTRSIQINSRLVKNNEPARENEIIPVIVEDDPPPLDEVQDLYSLEVQIFNMLNHIRAQKGLLALNLNPVVSNIARLRSTDMVNRNYFSHYSPEGKHITDILRENGIMYANSGEILFRASPPSYGPIEVIINTWLASNIHRDIIFSPQFTQVGISIIDGGNKRLVIAIFLN